MLAGLRQVADTLPSLRAAALTLITGRKTCPVKTYLLLARETATLDLTALEAMDFRRRFNGYYGVRRNEVWRGQYYSVFAAAKASAASSGALFEVALAEMHAVQGRVEASFVSKMIATLRPESPVIDSVVRGFLGRNLEIAPVRDLESACTFYGWLSEAMLSLAASPEARAWFAEFDASFAHVPDADAIHPVKKLDFLIWAGADR